MLPRTTTIVLALLLASCGSGEPGPEGPPISAADPACLAAPYAPLEVFVVNAQTGQLLCEAVVIVREPRYQESLRPTGTFDECHFTGPWGRVGASGTFTYDVVASRPPLRSALVTGITVGGTSRFCGAAEQTLTLRLTQ